jgi:hypothetical protein
MIARARYFVSQGPGDIPVNVEIEIPAELPEDQWDGFVLAKLLPIPQFHEHGDADVEYIARKSNVRVY